MRELEKPVARVFRRLRFQRFLAALVWSWAIALAIVAGVIAAEKLLNLRLPAPDWVPFAVAGLVGLVIAAVVSLALRPEPDGRGGGDRPGVSPERAGQLGPVVARGPARDARPAGP